jgi:uncharacterized protein (TIRG00374 family)
MKHSRWMIVLVFLGAAALLYLATRGVSARGVLHDLREARPGPLAMAFAVLTVSSALRALRWQIVLASEKVVAYPTVFCASMVGALGNNYLPARSGELMRSAWIGRAAAISTSFVLATALGERVLDALLLSGIGCLAVMALGEAPRILLSAAWIVGLGAAAGTLAILTLPFLDGPVRALLAKLPVNSARLAGMQRISGQFLLGMRAFRNTGRLAAFAGTTSLAWCMDAAGVIILARALGLSIAFPLALLLLAALGLSSGLPSTPGYVGIFQFVAVTVLAPFGFSRTQALAFIIAYQALTYTLVTFWGLLSLWLMRSDVLRKRGAAALRQNA